MSTESGAEVSGVAGCGDEGGAVVDVGIIRPGGGTRLGSEPVISGDLCTVGAGALAVNAGAGVGAGVVVVAGIGAGVGADPGDDAGFTSAGAGADGGTSWFGLSGASARAFGGAVGTISDGAAGAGIAAGPVGGATLLEPVSGSAAGGDGRSSTAGASVASLLS